MVGLDSRLNRLNEKGENPLDRPSGPTSNGTTGAQDAKVTRRGTPPVTPGAPAKEGPRDLTYIEAARKIKQEYTHGRKEPGLRGLDGVHSMLKQMMEDPLNLDELLKDTLKSIYTQFNLKEVTIALRSPDGLFRYVAMYGMGSQSWAAHQKLIYDDKTVMDPGVYKWSEISRHTKLFLAEDNPYSEADAQTRIEHLMLRSKRKSPDDSVEGDYLDVFIYGPKDETLGWIETSGTWDGKLPDARTIRGLEVISSVLALAIVRSQRDGTRQ